MATISQHIHFNGNAEEAFEFYRSIFGGQFARLMRFKDLSNPDFTCPDDELQKIMLIRLPIHGSGILSGRDVPSSLGSVNEEENRSKLCIAAQSKEEAESIFNGLSAGGKVEMPLDTGPWGTHLGVLRDKYGMNGWWNMLRNV